MSRAKFAEALSQGSVAFSDLARQIEAETELLAAECRRTAMGGFDSADSLIAARIDLVEGRKQAIDAALDDSIRRQDSWN